VYSEFFEITLPSLSFKRKGGICTNDQHIPNTEARTTLKRNDVKKMTLANKLQIRHSALMLNIFQNDQTNDARRTMQEQRAQTNQHLKENQCKARSMFSTFKLQK
jgi:hypothetical protein